LRNHRRSPSVNTEMTARDFSADLTKEIVDKIRAAPVKQ
jgi:hypothetical protein